MARLFYVTHPEVRIDGAVPVRRWGLTDTGRRRATAMLDQPWVASLDRILSSDETKALELAAIVATHRDLPVTVRAALGETDRDGTGYLPKERHDEVSDAWFANPERSPDGWEAALDVQRRTLDALDDVLGGAENVMVAGHGGAGTLLWCALSGTPIAQRHDQPHPGHYVTIDLADRRPLHRWRAIDDLEG